MIKKLIRNSSYIIFAQVLVKVISLFYNFYLASSLGSVENFGLYTVALSYFSLIGAISDFGISRYLVREIAKDNKDTGGLFTTVIILRVFALAIIFALFALFEYLYDPVSLRANISILAVLAVIPQAIALTIDGLFVALQIISLSAIGLIVLSLGTVFFGVILISMGYGLYGAIWGLLLGELLYALVFTFLLRKQKLTFTKFLDRKIIKEIVVGSLPYGLLGVLGLLYFKIDTLILAYLKGSYETGIYGASYKFLEAIIFVPSAIITVIFPIFAKLHDSDPTQVKKFYYKSLIGLTSLSLVIFIAYQLILPPLITIFLPKYIEGIEAIRVLAFTIPFMFAHTPAVLVLLSTDKYLKSVIAISFITLGFNVLLNFLLIPEYGYMGASYVTVFSEAFSFIVFFILLQRQAFKNG